MPRYELTRIRLYNQKWHKTIFAAHIISPDDERWIEDPEAARVMFDVTRAGNVT
jgi:hypothetical protein